MPKWMRVGPFAPPGGTSLADLFAALASDARIRILESLRQGPRFGWELQPELNLDQSVVSRHLATLRRVGLVHGEKQGNAVRYYVADERVFELVDLARRILATRLEKQRVFLGGVDVTAEQTKSGRNVMRIAFACDTNEGLDSTISAHFGRCPYYVFVDVEGGEVRNVEVVENPFYYDHGAPGQVPGFIANRGATAIVSGGMGPRAIGFFEQLGVEAVTGASGRVREVLEAYLDRQLAGAEPCDDHGEEHAHESPTQGESEEAVLGEIRKLQEQARQLQEQIQALQRLAETRGGEKTAS
ncbi:MAG: metalloregulator ArsR/SmtB family transcription factor [Calditrichaeota bacterium]|nr:metalloregulator ArsR/SmtB family transcription factor [Calditrichota bacterium]